MLRVREVRSERDFQRCVEIQRVVWRFSDPDVVSASMLRVSQKAGGIVKGAFLPKDGMVGFVYSFPAPLGSGVIQHSHMLAVLEQFRDRGIGQKLKWAQYRRAKELGNDRITWTFDPLESRNAFLNLHRLGSVATRYYVDLYGESTSSDLHAGLGTDRLLAEWKIQEKGKPTAAGRAVVSRARDIPRAIHARLNENGVLVPVSVDLKRTESPIAVEIPSSIQELKEADARIARLWRIQTRRAFTHYLARGYQVVDLKRVESRHVPVRSFYCLIKAGG